MESTEDASATFKALPITIPESPIGRQITLTCYIKTENMTGGYAGLWMRIDPNEGFDNMSDRGITGTTDWTKCEISLPFYPYVTEQIALGGILTGRGKIWIDDLKITVEGKPLKNRESLASQDNQFNSGSGITDIQPTPKKVYTTPMGAKLNASVSYPTWYYAPQSKASEKAEMNCRKRRLRL